MGAADRDGGDEDPITRKLRGLVAQQELERALSCPRVRRGTTGGYFIADCPHCDEEHYHHLSPHRDGPAGPAQRRELAWCEGCGVVEAWKVLGGLEDGSERVLGPDFGADGPPSSRPPDRD